MNKNQFFSRLSLYQKKGVTSGITLLCVGISGHAQGYIGLDPAYTGTEYGDVVSAPLDVDEEGGLLWYPSVGISATYDDNIYRTEINTDDAMIYRLHGVLEARNVRGKTTYNAGYRGSVGRYSGGPNDDLDDYEDHNLFAGIYHTGSKTSSSVYADYQRGYTPRGEDNFEEKDTWDQYTVLGRFDLGRSDARFRLRLSGVLRNRLYDINSANDLNNAGFGAVLGMKVSSKTRLVLEGGRMDYNYDNSNKDGHRIYLRGGASWKATGKTTGTFTYGQEKYTPENAGQPVESDEPGLSQGVLVESDDTTWKGEILWLPTREDSVSLNTSKSTTESFGIGTNKIATRTTANWGHSWSNTVSSAVSYIFGNYDYIGDPRNDDIEAVNIGLNYRFRHNQIVRGDWQYEKRDSNVPLESYDQNRYSLVYGYDF